MLPPFAGEDEDGPDIGAAPTKARGNTTNSKRPNILRYFTNLLRAASNPRLTHTRRPPPGLAKLSYLGLNVVDVPMAVLPTPLDHTSYPHGA